MIRRRAAGLLPDWLARAEAAPSPEVRGFAAGVRQDEAAVSAALQEEGSNGQVEGKVNKLKTTKRAQYGRATFDLLRRRVLHAA